MATATETLHRGVTVPVPYRVRQLRRETHDTWTLELDPLAEPIVARPGQFTMLYAQGVGEVPISMSGAPGRSGHLTHTIRSVGPVTAALCSLWEGAVVGVRGPFGTTWPLEEARGRDLVIVAGGIGLAPLRPAILDALAHRKDVGKVTVLVGARGPGELLYTGEMDAWTTHPGVTVEVTVDAATPEWGGRVGLVTELVRGAPFDARSAVAMVCGPEVMMRFTARALLLRGMPKDRIWVSMERNMRCGVGHCGHCQLGPLLVCRDGAVVRYDEVEDLMRVREL